jgi:hypothetical protein
VAEEPAAPLPAASIIIGAEATDIVDANGTVLGSLRYATDGAAAVALATQLLGEPTGVEYVDRMSHFVPVDVTKWGGFAILVGNYEPYKGEVLYRPTGDELLYEPPFSVAAISAEASAGVAIVAVDGTAVGDAYSSVSAGMEANVLHRDETFGFASAAVDLPTSFPAFTIDAEGIPPIAHGVIATAEGVDGPIKWITAPADLFSLV